MSINKKITDVLKKKEFTLSVEIVPPRNGEDISELFKKIEQLKTIKVDFISVTKGAGGSLRGGTLPISYFIKNKYKINTIAHFTCRDYSIKEVENNIVDHNYFGVNNILALRGDPPVGSPDIPHDKGEYHKYAYQLVHQLNNLNDGKYLPREGYDEGSFKEGLPTDFCVGVACDPNHADIKQEIRFFRKKAEAGASFAITQMIFDLKRYVNYVKEAEKEGINIPIIPGIMPFTSLKQLTFMEEKFNIPIPEKLKKELEGLTKEEAKEKSIKYIVELCRALKDVKAPGIHFFILNDIETLSMVISGLKELVAIC